MRLLQLDDGGGFSLVEFVGKNIPPYAVLSHTWGPDHEEVTFKDLMDSTGSGKAGYKKIHFCTTQAARDGLHFSWIDTCCIDKSSSAELSEAINSMFRWYHDAAKCYVYLPDVSIGSSIENRILYQRAFQNSRWFTRGWTLQELIAPTSLEFFSVEGLRLGDKYSKVQEIHGITGISIRALQGNPLSEFSIDERMSWAAKRETKREEDAAYSLLGIFDVHMPLLYGEGRKKALIRLHREVREALRVESPSVLDNPQHQRIQKTRAVKHDGLMSTKISNTERAQDFNDLETAAQSSSQEQREQQPGGAQSIRSTSGIIRIPTPDMHRPESVDRVAAEDMADDSVDIDRVGTPSPHTRPKLLSVGRREQQSREIKGLKDRVHYLTSKLAEFKEQAERSQQENQASSSILDEKDNEIDVLNRQLDLSYHEVAQLVEQNEALTSANVNLTRQHSDRYAMLESQLAQTTRELAETRNAHEHLWSGLEDMVRNKDYFKNAFRQLCDHMQEWASWFSTCSDTTACRLTREIDDDKIITRLDNAVLDGSDVDFYLADRVKRRDVFTSILTVMVREYVFTRYLFGMERQQRQQLKSLEETVSKAGPTAAVRLWRATTLTLMSKQEECQRQRERDTKNVVRAIMETFSVVLQPPSNLTVYIERKLEIILELAVDLSIEMRCQRAEYEVLPPLLPEYDVNGDLKNKVFFNAAIMSECSGEAISDEALEAEKAIVRMVLFPLVVKKGDDRGEGDDEVVVCPAQVLVAESNGGYLGILRK